MDPISLGYIGILLMLTLALFGIPLAYAMLGVATSGLWIVTGLDSAATQNLLVVWEQGSSFSLMTIPLFIFMGTVAYQTGIVADLFTAVRKWIGHVPGGLAVAGVVAAAAFGAVTGSTAASVATMGSTVMPELKKYGYSLRLGSGAMAASGGLAAVIPPSVFIIIFCVLTDQSIGELFIATIGPGLLLTALFCLIILVWCKIRPQDGPASPKATWRERINHLSSSLPVAFTFVIVIGGLYAGIVTPTEAAAIGVLGIMVIAAVMRRLTIKALKIAFREGATLSTVILLLVVGGWVMSRFLVISGTTRNLVELFVSIKMSTYMLIFIMFLLYLILGCILEATSILILTMPILFPVTQAYAMEPAWFGVFVTMMVVLAGITPPVGLNAFVLHGVFPEASITEIFIGAVPFILMMCLCIFIITVFPDIVLWLPRSLK